MPQAMSRFGRGASFIITFALAAVLLAACGGGTKEDSGPTPTAMAMSSIATSTATAAAQPAIQPTLVATPQPAQPGASPIASLIASPLAPMASPVSGWTRSITRADFEQQLLAAFPMEQPAKNDGTLIVGESSDISTLNPTLVNDSLTAQIVGAMFETLVGVSPIDGQLVPALADYWEVSPDNLTYIFHINQAAKWHDGVDVTADDVQFSFDAAMNPNTGSSYTTLFKQNIASYRVIDADTFEVTAQDRFVSFLQNGPGSISIVPKHIWEQTGFEAWSFDSGSTGADPSRVIGSGPFKFKEWVQGDHITLVRNDDYYTSPPNLASVIFRVLPDTNSAVQALGNGETDVLEILPAADTQEFQNKDGFKVDIYPINLTTLYMLNLDPAKTQLFQEREVRQAMMMALDRDLMTQTIYYGFGEAGAGTQPPLSPAYAPDQMTPSLAYDPDGAKALLDSIGWRDTNNDGVVDRGGVKMSFSFMYVSGDATTNEVVAFLQESWKKIGIDVELDAVGSDILTANLTSHDFDVALVPIQSSSDWSQTSFFACDQYESGLNFMRYCNDQWDQLDQQQQREFDPEKRIELLIQQSQIIWEDEPVGVIRFGIARTGYSDTVHNFYPNGYGFLWSLPYVWSER